MYALKKTSEPSQMPLIVDTILDRLSLDSEFSFEIKGLLAVGTAEFEAATNRQIITAGWLLVRDAFPAGSLPLPKGQLQTVDSIKYFDTNNDLQTIDPSSYTISQAFEPALITHSTAWPATYARPDAVQVAFTCGYGSGRENVPRAILEAIILKVRTMFDPQPVAGQPLGAEQVQYERIVNQFRLGDEFENYG